MIKGANIEHFGPVADKSQNGYGKGWTKKECLKAITIDGPKIRKFVAGSIGGFFDGTSHLEYKNGRVSVIGIDGHNFGSCGWTLKECLVLVRSGQWGEV